MQRGFVGMSDRDSDGEKDSRAEKIRRQRSDASGMSCDMGGDHGDEVRWESWTTWSLSCCEVVDECLTC